MNFKYFLFSFLSFKKKKIDNGIIIIINSYLKHDKMPAAMNDTYIPNLCLVRNNDNEIVKIKIAIG
jgi:hypothetical protein